MGDQDLAQLCGCNMAVDKSKLGPRQLFDCAFTNAGDDVDFSWRLRDAEMTLAYAPGAIVLHERRTTIGAYLKQQRGYGLAEGLLFRKYPNRQGRVYGDSHWYAQWFGAGSRIYYGAFGRGLFQTIYPRSWLPPAAQFPLTFQWVAPALILAMTGIFDRSLGILGIAGLLITLSSAVAGAAASGGKLRGFASRAILIGLWVLGPLLRSWERERVKWSFAPDASGAATSTATRLSGTIALVAWSPESPPGDAIPPNVLDEMMRGTASCTDPAWSGSRQGKQLRFVRSADYRRSLRSHRRAVFEQRQRCFARVADWRGWAAHGRFCDGLTNFAAGWRPLNSYRGRDMRAR